MNGTGWPRRGGWDSYLVRKSRSELDDGRVYGVKSKEGSVEVLVLSSNNVCSRILPEIARLSTLKHINLSDNHISGPIPAELGLLLQLETLHLEGNNLRGICFEVSECTLRVRPLSASAFLGLGLDPREIKVLRGYSPNRPFPIHCLDSRFRRNIATSRLQHQPRSTLLGTQQAYRPYPR